MSTAALSVSSTRPAPAEQICGLFAALADPTRIRILNLLAGGELCVCDLVELLEQPQPTVSRHLAHLRRLRLAAVRRRGRFAYYRIAEPAGGLEHSLLELVRHALADVDGLDDERRAARTRAKARALEPCPE